MRRCSALGARVPRPVNMPERQLHAKEPSIRRQAFRAGVADRLQHFRDATAAACGETPGGGFSRAMSTARSRACGSARSCIQPCSSHSRMAPASCSTAIAQPRNVRIVGGLTFVISIEISPAGTNPGAHRSFRLLTQGSDSKSG
jgi:hypothetical protein